MTLGVDFDNTLVRYDELFHRLAVERGFIPASTPVRKEAVRDRMRADGREPDWTRLQGDVYGPGMELAPPFEGALECLARVEREGGKYWIISHRTRKPFDGPPHDLHAAARSWLKRHGVPDARVVLEETRQAKLARIGEKGCTQFVDDLPELLSDPAFPAGVEKLWFDPDGASKAQGAGLKRLKSWAELERWIFRPAGS